MKQPQVDWCRKVVTQYASSVGVSFDKAVDILSNRKAYNEAYKSVNLDEYLNIYATDQYNKAGGIYYCDKCGKENNLPRAKVVETERCKFCNVMKYCNHKKA